jgi:hypothetical protein
MLTAERGLYLVVSVLLLVSAAAALVAIGYGLVDGLSGGTLHGVVLVLAASSFLVRRKEREPDEG